MKILFLTRSINNVLGGLERQILEISENLSSGNHTIMVVSLDSGEINSFYGIPAKSKVVWHGLGVGSPNRKANLREKVRRQTELIKVICKFDPDVSVSFMIGAFIYSRLPHFICRKKLILSERNSPDIYKLTSAKRFRYLYFFLMLFAKKTQFVYAGRFSFQKQLDKLIQIFVAYRNQGGVGKLGLYGDGEAKTEIEELIKQLGGNEYISINPPVTDLSKIFSNTKINCLFSIWEGFPNSLAEGLKAGIPAVGFKSCDGVSNLIINNYNGWLMKDDGNYINSGMKLLEIDNMAKEEFNIIKSNCKESVAKYEDHIIFEKWTNLFYSIKSS